MTRACWWKIYFALIFTAMGISVTIGFTDTLEQPWWEWLFVPLYALQIIALFGFVFGRRIAIETLWQVLFVLTVCYEFWSAYQMVVKENLFSAMPGFFGLALVAAIYLLHVPLWVGLFIYAFRSRLLWHA